LTRDVLLPGLADRLPAANKGVFSGNGVELPALPVPLASGEDVRRRVVQALMTAPLPAIDMGGQGDLFMHPAGVQTLAKLSAVGVANPWLARRGGRWEAPADVNVDMTDWADIVFNLQVYDLIGKNVLAGPYDLPFHFNN
jgi:hypothetical protein